MEGVYFYPCNVLTAFTFSKITFLSFHLRQMVIYEKRQQWRQIEARTSVVKTGWLVAMTTIIACSQKEGKEEEETTRTPEVSSGKREKPGVTPLPKPNQRQHAPPMGRFHGTKRQTSVLRKEALKNRRDLQFLLVPRPLTKETFPRKMLFGSWPKQRDDSRHSSQGLMTPTEMPPAKARGERSMH